MAGRVKQLIDELIELRAGDNQGVAHFLKAHLMLIGIDPSRYTATTADDRQKELRLESMINDFARQRRSM